MPKNCINCKTPISGTGQNKAFCSDCLQKITPFFKFIAKSKVPAKKLYELNLERLKGLGLSELTLAYIEKCCVKLDESRAAAGTAPVIDPADKVPPKSDETSASAIVSAAISASINAEKSQKSEISAPKSDEFSRRSERTTSENSPETVKFDTSEVKSADDTLPPAVTTDPASTHRLADESVSEYDDEFDCEDDDYELSSKTRIALIIAAAATAFIIFLSLYLSGILPTYTPAVGSESNEETDTSPFTDTETLPPETDTSEPDTAETVFVCTHEWEEANCSVPATCSLCGETDGEPLGHNFTEATCKLPSICLRCATIESDALEHDWSEATCSAPQTCSLCGEVNGAPIDHNFKYDADENDNVCTYCGKTQASITGVRACDHDWSSADCDSAKTCSRCGKVDGESLGHDWHDATCTSPKTCSRCELTEGEALTHSFSEPTCTAPASCIYCGITEGEPLGHTKGGVKCSACGEYLVSVSSVGTEIHDKSGLTVLIQSIESTPTDTGKLYYVQYTVTNNSPDSMLEGAFKLFLEEGGGIDPPGVAYTTLDPGASVTHTYTFEVENGKTPLILEYFHDGGILIFANEPHTTDEALYWILP